MAHSTPTDQNPTHDFLLIGDVGDGGGEKTYGFMYARSPYDSWSENPMSSGTQVFKKEQKDWTSGRGRPSFGSDPTGYYDSDSMWTMTPENIFPAPQWKFATGLRSANFYMPGCMSAVGTPAENVSFVPIYHQTSYTPSDSDAPDYIAVPFTVDSSGYSARYIYLWLRQIGTPTGALTVSIYTNNSTPNPDVPNALVASATGTIAVANGGIISRLLRVDFGSSVALTASTIYWVVVKCDSGDTAANCWEIGVDVAGSSTQTSVNGSTWVTGTFTFYYRVTDAVAARRFLPFYFEGAWYAIAHYDASASAPDLYINGDRGRADSGSTTLITDTSQSWITDQWVGARVHIYSGSGDGCSALITGNGTDHLHIEEIETAAASGSLFVIYDTPIWTKRTGHLMTGSNSKKYRGTPCVYNGIAYFPQGSAAHINKMCINASTGMEQYDLESGNHADYIGLYEDDKGDPKLAFISSTSSSYNIGTPLTVATYTNDIAVVAGKSIGSSDYIVTNVINFDGNMYIFKENSLWKLVNGSPKEVDVGLKDMTNRYNGSAACVHGLWLYFSRSQSVVQMQGATVKDIENFSGGYLGLPEDRCGEVSGLTGGGGWVFKATDAGPGDISSVMAWNGYGWHEVIRGYMDGARIRNCWWQPNLESRPQLWANIHNDMIFITMPKNGANPLNDSGMRFMHEGHIVTSVIDLGERHWYKFFKQLSFLTTNLSATREIHVDFQSDNYIDSATWTTKTTHIDDSPWHSLVLELGLKIRQKYRFRFRSTSASTPAILHSWGVDGHVMETPKFTWSAICLIGDNVENMLGVHDADPDVLLDWLKNAARTKAKLTVNATKTSFHEKIVTIENPVTKMTLTDMGRWDGIVWLTMREG